MKVPSQLFKSKSLATSMSIASGASLRMAARTPLERHPRRLAAIWKLPPTNSTKPRYGQEVGTLLLIRIQANRCILRPIKPSQLPTPSRNSRSFSFLYSPFPVTLVTFSPPCANGGGRSGPGSG